MKIDQPRLLVVEDEAPQREIIAGILRRHGYDVRDTDCAESAIELIETLVPDVILCDWKMPGIGGDGLLSFIGDREFHCGFIVMTAYGSIAHAVDAIRRGADDYLSKPFERETLLLAVQRVLHTFSLERENRRLREEIEVRDGFGPICGQADSMQALYRTLNKVAATDVTVLLSGESGTGKELVARTLHDKSRRNKGPFVAVNCAAIPETLIESELFGYERGAFTGADRRREGRFDEARNGTLFLDEIPSLPLPLQGTLLRVLQERRFTRLGGQGEVECNVRIIAAANRDLSAMVEEGTFREDLYYRLNVLPVRIPPLRERREDIPLLAQTFCKQAGERHGIPQTVLSPSMLRQLMTYDWPGNVRELANVVERLILLSDDGRINPDDLPVEIRDPAATAGCPFRLPPGGINWDEMEAGLLSQALSLADGNRSRAARLLGMNYKAFLYRLDKHSI